MFIQNSEESNVVLYDPGVLVSPSFPLHMSVYQNYNPLVIISSRPHPASLTASPSLLRASGGGSGKAINKATPGCCCQWFTQSAGLPLFGPTPKRSLLNTHYSFKRGSSCQSALL